MLKSDPIRNNKDIKKMKQYFIDRGNWRDYALFILGINSALRIGDILALKWKMVYNFETNRFKSHLKLKEHKTNKNNTIALNKNVVEALTKLKMHLSDIKPDDYIIKSRCGENKPIHRSRAYIIIRNAAHANHIEGIICCHSLRKTFGYHAWNQGVPPAIIMEIYNHSSMSVTRMYLSINQDEKDKVFNSLLL